MAKHFALRGLALMACSSARVSAQSTNNINGTSSTFVTTAVPFLRISPDARAGAMGDAGIAVSPDANSQYWNASKIPFTSSQYGISATYTPWLKDLVPDIFLAYLAGYAKFGEEQEQAISASMRYFSLGNINYTDYIGNSIGTGMPREYSFDLGYSRKLSEYLSAGVTLRYIHSAIASGVNLTTTGSDYKPGNAFAGDLGMFYTKSFEKTEGKINTFNFGAVISNLGSKISYNSTRRDFIPQNLGIGAAYTAQMDEYNKITYWSPSGCEFIIKDINKFQQLVLPKYFRHNKINSFIRQLNMYGFHKSRADHTKSVFSHPLFLKDREYHHHLFRDLLINIKRKIKGKLEQENLENHQTP